MELKSGRRMCCVSCGAELVVVRPPAGPVVLSCGGEPMREPGSTTGPIAGHADASAGVLVGKRYVDESSGLEVLATRAGTGELTVDGRAAAPKSAKPLPASD